MVVAVAIVATTVVIATTVVSAPPKANVRINVARIIVAGIVAIWRVNVGRTRIRIARTGVRIATSVGATVVAWLTTGVRPRGTVSAPGIIVTLVDRQKCMLTLRGIDGDRVNEAEAERRLRPDDRGTTARQQDRADSRCGAGSRADGSACTPTGSSSNRRPQRGRAADRGGVSSVRCAAGALPQLGENGPLLAVDQSEVGELDAELRGALHAARFLCGLHLAGDGLAATRDHVAVHHDGRLQRGGDAVAHLIVVTGKIIVDAHLEYGARGNGQRRGRRLHWYVGARRTRRRTLPRSIPVRSVIGRILVRRRTVLRVA